MIVRKAEFSGRAQHPLTLNASKLAQLNTEGLAILARWKIRADDRARDLDTSPCVWGATHNVQHAVEPGVNLTDSQPISVGVLFYRLDLTYDHATEWWRHWIKLLDFQSGHGQGVSQLLGCKRRITKLAQPGFRKLHG